MKLASRMDDLGTEAAFEMLAKARALEAQGQHIVHMEIGEPDFDTPEDVVSAGTDALEQGYTHYGPTAGLPELRDAIARDAGPVRGVEFSPDSVVVMPGAKPVMFFTILALAEPGNEVIYPNPGFPVFESMVRFCGAKAVPMRFLEEKAYHPDLDDLEANINENTRLIIINSPQNPTGAVFSPDELSAIADMARKYDDLYILSDEIYKDIVYSGQHASIMGLPGMQERTILLDGFSKSYAMTGWRLGYGIFPDPLVEHIVKLSANSVSCAATFTQRAALQALEGPQDRVIAMTQEFKARRDLIANGLRSIPGVTCPDPEGAFYAFPSVKGTGMTSAQFEDRALQSGVALLSGAGFGEYGEGYVRLSYATSQDNIKLALDRLKNMVTGQSA